MELPTPDPGQPGTPQPAPAELPAAEARELVVRLSKALQRAAIYPEGHPSVLRSADPFLETLRSLLRVSPTVVVGITREAVFVGTDPQHVRPHAAPWLTARLSGQNIASLTFDDTLSVEEARRVLAWIAKGDTLAPDVAAPAFEGCEIACVDFSSARFRESRLADVHLSPEELAWRAIACGLLGISKPDTVEVPTSPAELASWVRSAIEQLEGTGVQDVSDRLVSAGIRLDTLPDPVRASVKAKLSAFVSALSPELRGQVLTASPSDAPEKLALLTHVVDHLPSAQVVDVVRSLAFTRGSSTHQFMSLMLKLTGLSASDGGVADALEARLKQEGLAGNALAADQRQIVATLEELLRPRLGDVAGVNPESYQRRLETLSASSAEPVAHRYDASRHVDPGDGEAVAAQTGRIAIQLLRADASPGDTPAFCERLRAQLPGYLAAHDFELLGDIALQLMALSPGEAPTGGAGAGAVLDFYSEPGTVDVVLEALLEGPPDIPAPLMVLARAAGAGFVEALLRALQARPTTQAWTRAAALLPDLDFDVIRAAFARAYKLDPSHARGLLSLVHASSGLPVVVDVAPLFLADADPAVRLDAYRLLFACRLSPGRMDALLRKALEDDSAAVVRLALDDAERRSPGPRPETLARFLDADSPHPDLQRRAAAILGAQRTPESRDAMIGLLARRTRTLDGHARLVSRRLALALEALDDEGARRAARAWLWSPAGMLSRVMGDGSRP